MIEKCLICGLSSDYLFSKDDWNSNFKFYKCRNCTHVFVYPQPTIKDLDLFYNQEYYVSEFQRLKVRKKGAYILKHISKTKIPMLEIGCSYGYFLEYMDEQGIKVDGLELSQIASQKAKEKGFDVICGSIENDLTLKKYYSVFLFDVLEHLPNPSLFLKLISNRMLESGEIFITVPNQCSLEFKFFKKYWEWTSPPAHLHYFNYQSIAGLLNQSGFSIEIVDSFKGDSAGNIFFHFYDFLRRMVLFNLGYFYFGRTKFLEKKKAYNLKQKDLRQHKPSEFNGFNYWIYRMTNFLELLDRLIRNKMNEPTLFLKATKK